MGVFQTSWNKGASQLSLLKHTHLIWVSFDFSFFLIILQHNRQIDLLLSHSCPCRYAANCAIAAVRANLVIIIDDAVFGRD